MTRVERGRYSTVMLRALRRTRLASLFALFIITGSVPISTAALLHDASDDLCQPTLVQHRTHWSREMWILLVWAVVLLVVLMYLARFVTAISDQPSALSPIEW